ncbi:MAG TPA: 50S ribosomal protein L33 [Candidatus Angelobacter sp.]|nr:50S ribosomal protein L33 [Candidatus Angelobacter sp.]
MVEKLKLECSVCKQMNYTTSKSRDNRNERLELSKFCGRCNKHTIHRETK